MTTLRELFNQSHGRSSNETGTVVLITSNRDKNQSLHFFDHGPLTYTFSKWIEERSQDVF